MPAWSTPNVGVRTVPPFVGGLWADLMQVTGCRPRTGSTIAADVRYRPDGRPAAVAASDANLPPACLRVAGVLFALMVAEAPLPRPATFSDVVVVWLQPDALACVDHLRPAVVDFHRGLIAQAVAARCDGTARTQRAFVEAKKIADMLPAYSPEAQRRRLEGDVFVNAVLAPDGCFGEASVAESPSPMLSGPALLSILAWRYSPATLDGHPVPRDMRLTVHFALPRH